jgi:membrane-bound lytic murein transglycosylase B
MKKILFILLILPCLLFARIDYSKHPQAKAFVNKMHKRYKFDTHSLYKLLKKAKHQPKTLARYSGRHKVGATDFSWHRYKSKILIPESIALGKKFMQRNKKWLKKAERKYSISPAIITAFIRVESKFGMYGSEYGVWDSLVTLAFNPNRKQKFFRGELEKSLILARREHLDVRGLRGSFAGAMGCVQQVPSMYLRHGVDLDGDGKRNPNSIADCIGSIASFLHRQKWNNRIPAVVRASYPGKRFRALRTGYRTRYPMSKITAHGIKARKPFAYKSAYLVKVRDSHYDELYLGTRNYRIITRYNASARYAVTIALYAEAMEREWRRVK